MKWISGKQAGLEDVSKKVEQFGVAQLIPERKDTDDQARRHDYPPLIPQLSPTRVSGDVMLT